MSNHYKVNCQWCGRRRGIVKEILLCPICDYTPVGGPPTNEVKDVDPKP